MGMFDWVDFQTKCPNCGELVTSFQSKDGECQMDTIPYWEVDRFYSSCKKCRTWIEFKRIRPVGKPYVPIQDYFMEYTKLDGRKNENNQ